MSSPPLDFDPSALEEDMAAVRALGQASEPDASEVDHGASIPSSKAGPGLNELRGSLDAAIQREQGALGQLRSRPTSQRLALVVIMAAIATAAALFMSPTEHLSGPGLWRFGAVMLLVALLTVLACWRLLRPLHLPPANAAFGNVLLAAGVALPFLMAWALSHPGGNAAAAGAGFFKQCAGCLAFGVALGLPVLGLALLLRRAKVDGAAIGALAGVAAGLTGYLTLHIHCTISDPAHVMGGHASVLLVMGAGAALWRLRERRVAAS